MVMANGNEQELYPINGKIKYDARCEFTTGDTVELVYNYNDNRFFFRNLATGKIIQRKLNKSVSKSREILYIGVILDKEGDSVRYISKQLNWF
jgi:hypothetical protein